MDTDHYIISYDPGVSTGVALGVVEPGEPYRLIQAYQFKGGALGLKNWLEDHEFGCWFAETGYVGGDEFTPVSERFQPINHSNYALTTASVTPLVCEGVLLALDVMPDYDSPRWLAPTNQYFVGGKDLAEKKKRSRKFLKDTGNYRLPKQLGAPDNNDMVSATLHGIAFAMKSLKSEATFRMVTDWTEQNG